MGVRGMNIYMAMLPFLAVQMISVTFFQSLGKPSRAIALNLSQSALFYLMALAVLPRFWGLDGVWAATSFSHLAGGILALFLVIPERIALGNDAGDTSPGRGGQRDSRGSRFPTGAEGLGGFQF